MIGMIPNSLFVLEGDRASAIHPLAQQHSVVLAERDFLVVRAISFLSACRNMGADQFAEID